MLSARLIGVARNFRNFSTSRFLKDVKPPEAPIKKPNETIINSSILSPNAFEKRILVWFKKYPSIDQVPKQVPIDVVQAATSRFRIRCANIMIICTAIGCLYTVLVGKRNKAARLAEAGFDTAHEDYRKQITEEFRQSMKAEAAAAKK